MFKIDSPLQKLRVAFIISIISVCVALFFTKPKILDIDRDLNTNDHHLWEAVEIKKINLASDLSEFTPNSGEAKYVFRLTAPLIMKVFDLNRKSMFIVVLAFGFLTYIYWNLICLNLFKNVKYSFILSIALATSYFGVAFYIDSGTPINTISYLLVLMAIYFAIKRSYFLYPILILMFFNDERAILAYSFIGFYHLFNQDFNFKKLLREEFILLCSTFLFCLIIKVILSQTWNISTPLSGVGLDILIGQWKYLNFGLFTGLEGFVIPIGVTCYFFFRKKKWIELFFTLGISTIFIIGASIVSDMTKSIAYLVPFAILLLYRIDSLKVDIKYLLASIVIINLITPTTVAVGPNLFSWYSLGFDIFFKITNILL
jgi:hypothetical protein